MDDSDPLAIGRQRASSSFAESNRGRTVETANVDGVRPAATLARFGKKNGFAVGGNIPDERPIEPGQRALTCKLAGHSGRFHAFILLDGQCSTFRCVEKRHRTWNFRDQALTTGRCNGIERTAGTARAGGEPNFVA